VTGSDPATVLSPDFQSAAERRPSQPEQSPSRRTFAAIRRNPVSLAGLTMAIAIVLFAIAAPVLNTDDPTDLNPAHRLLPPSGDHWFGTDDGGRDVYSRVLYGARYSLLAAAVVLAIASSIGTLVGLVAGYFGGKVDELLMRVTDMFLAFPALVLAMGVSAALGASLTNAMIAISVVWWPWYARLVRGQALHLKQEAFVEAARASGGSGWHIMRLHVFPNCQAPIIVQMSLDVGYAILTTASLSFIGLGAQPPTPEWGSMIAVGKDFILDQWWFATFPGVAIFITVMAFNLLGDGLQESLSPTLRKR
jgi:peptide/nickel transport system permease protein